MTPAMTPAEVALFSACCESAHNYVEFGCGGSTLLAARLVSGGVITVNSDPAWLDNVNRACMRANLRQPKSIYVDIGPVGSFGHPTSVEHRIKWPQYHEVVWDELEAHIADLYLIDGRFRVACLLQVLAHARMQSVIVFHDYWTRSHYHVIKRFTRLLCRVDDLAVLTPRIGFHRDEALAVLDQYRFDPA